MVATLGRLRRALASASFAAISVAHAAGTLDPTFANGATTLTGLRYLSLAVSPDQRIAVAGTGWGGSAAQVKLGAVAIFDNAGQGMVLGSTSVALPPDTYNHSADAVAFDPLGRVVVSGARLMNSPGAFTVRLRTDGQPSATYRNGAPGVVPPSLLGSALALAIDRKSRIVIGGSTAFYGGGTQLSSSGQPVIARLTADGANDLSFGSGGQVVLASPGVVHALAVDERGGIVFAFGASETTILMRLSEDGTIDTEFGDGGQSVVPKAVAAAGGTRGQMLVIAQRTDSSAGNRLLRFVDGRPDPTFGDGGAAVLPREYWTVTAAEDGSAFVGTVERAEGQRNMLRILRLRHDGRIDTTYGTDGEALVAFALPHPSGGSSYPSLAVDAQGRLLVTASRFDGYPYPTAQIQHVTVMLYRFTADAPDMPATGTAIEYRHASFDHYFVTADTDEIAKLDAGAFEDWTRTGESFTVQLRASGATMPVCRFFSGNTFAPRSSHFYTPYADECDTVDAGSAWDFEKLAFFLTLPTGAGKGNGTCATGAIPLYRAFNAMQGGAPNHRYTTRAATLDAMIASGWIMEGEANTRVFACVPQ